MKMPEPSCYINAFFMDAKPLKREYIDGLSTQEMCAQAFAAQQNVNVYAKNFWSTVVPAVRMPIPTQKVNERNHQKFNPPHKSGFFYVDACNKLDSSNETQSQLGVIVNFLRTCRLESSVSRYDLVMRLLGPWATAARVDLRPLTDALHVSGTLASDWARPIFNTRGRIGASMLNFAVNMQFKSGWEYTPQVGLATDILWMLVSQALYAGSWKSTGQERVAVVHTSNMSYAAQGLVYLFMHTSVPKSAVPACVDGRVLIAEPSIDPVDAGQAIGIPYRARLHVDAAFLNDATREPRHMQVVSTALGTQFLISKCVQILDRAKGDIGSDVIHEYDICPYPPESVAHMLSVVPSIMRTHRSMHRQYPELSEYAGNNWVLAMRLFACNADGQSLLHIPVALTECAIQEEIPCVTFKDGFCFVLCIQDGMVCVKPVELTQRLSPYNEDQLLCDHSLFTRLPLAPDQVELSFPAELLSYAMTSGLVLFNGVAKFAAPDLLTQSKSDVKMHPIPFTFMPIIRFQALLLLELLEETEEVKEQYQNCKRTYPEDAESKLTFAVLSTHPGTAQFMRNGYYHARYIDAENCVRDEQFDYIFTSQCILVDGRRVFCTFTAEEYTHMLDTISKGHLNEHVKSNCKFALDRSVPTRGGFVLECFYTLSDQTYKAQITEVMVRIAFVVKNQNEMQGMDTIMYFEVNLFDKNNKARLHIIRPDGPAPIVPHFYWQKKN
jgi:hypothetical protein